MTITIVLTPSAIARLDLSPAIATIAPLLPEIARYEQQLRVEFHLDRDPQDPRELSEIPEVRLWFIKLDVYYPWLPFLLDWRAGELARYAAMLVPHQFSRSEGIQYNPEALEIFVMHKVFILQNWLQQHQLPSSSRLKAMTQIFGYDIDDSFLQ